MKQLVFKSNILAAVLYTLLAFPFFYFVYKFGVLLDGYEDAKSYFQLFVDIHAVGVPTPFNMRLLSPILIKGLHQTGLFYSTQCAIDAFPEIDKSLFFSNIFYNYICVVLTSFSVYYTFPKLGHSKSMSFLAGVLYLLGFGTLFYMMMPGVDALSVLIFTWLLYFYFRKNYLVGILLLALIFQREYFFLVMLLMSAMDYFKFGKHRFYVVVFAISAFAWAVYFLLRKYVFMTPHWHYQTSARFLVSAILDMRMDLVTMFRQTFMTMNIFFIYLLILLYKKVKKMEFNQYYLWMTMLMFIQITVLSIATTSGNNNGRYFYFATPFFLYLILLETKDLFTITFLSVPSGKSNS
jgi:hypothetical protein